MLALARGIRVDQAFDRMPILADALEEAGCDDPVILDHCRVCESHVMGCWTIRVVLDFVSQPPPLPPPPQKPTRLGRILDGMQEEMRVILIEPDVRAYGPDAPGRAIARVGCVVIVMSVFVAILVLMALGGVR